jgi:hypothetical protein
MSRSLGVICLALCFFVSACSSGASLDAGVVGTNGTLTQLAPLTEEEDCPNGGVTLEHGIDKDMDGSLASAEIIKTYVICHGRDAEVTALQAEVDALKARVDLNDAKVGITSDQIRAIEANAVKVGISVEQANEIVANTAKNFPEHYYGYVTQTGTVYTESPSSEGLVVGIHPTNSDYIWVALEGKSYSDCNVQTSGTYFGDDPSISFGNQDFNSDGYDDWIVYKETFNSFWFNAFCF